MTHHSFNRKDNLNSADHDQATSTLLGRRTLLKHIVSAAAICPTCLSAASVFASEKPAADGMPDAKSHGKAHWEYGGKTGPEHWGDLSPEYSVCNQGLAQSPINLTDAISSNLTDIKVNYQPTPLEVVNNGHTIQANVKPGSSILLDGKKFKLLQFHFHHPSECLTSAPMEQISGIA